MLDKLTEDSTLVPYEIFHSMYSNSSGGAVVIKLDTSKAYNQVEWPFLNSLIFWLGFRPY